MTLYEKQQELMEFILNNGKELPSAFIASRQYIIKELGKTEGWSYGKVMTQLDVLHEKGKLYNLPHDLIVIPKRNCTLDDLIEEMNADLSGERLPIPTTFHPFLEPKEVGRIKYRESRIESRSLLDSDDLRELYEAFNDTYYNA
jgi:hypothetical protein